MLPGFNGHLLSEFFLEATLARSRRSDAEQIAAGKARRRLQDQLRLCETLGPATGTLAIIETAAVPLAELLGFEAPRDFEPVEGVLIATMRSGPVNAILMVTRWGERLDAFWRTAVTHATARSASWCVLFNGRQIRLLDPRRPYTRRYTQFDLEIAADDDRTFAAFWMVMQKLPLGLRELVEASEQEAARVCRSLRDGVLSASGEILGALVRPTATRAPAPLGDSFEQALT